MSAYLAIVFVCAVGVGPEACDETRALDVLSTRVPNELACTVGWQEIVARSALKEEIGTRAYLKTACRRVTPRPDGTP